MDLYLNIFSSNITSLLSIYEDADKARLTKRGELLKKLFDEGTWTDEEFNSFSHYESHSEWILMHSLFISAFSYFEIYMQVVAKKIELNSTSKIKLKDIRGNGDLDCYRKYINYIGQIEFASNEEKTWKKIIEFKTIRNSIVHKNGVIDKKVNLIKNYDLYYGPNEKMIRIKNLDFLKDFCKYTIDYMTKLTAEIEIKTAANTM